MIEKQRYVDNLAMSAFASRLSKKYLRLPATVQIWDHITYAKLYELLYAGIENPVASSIAENSE